MKLSMITALLVAGLSGCAANQCLLDQQQHQQEVNQLKSEVDAANAKADKAMAHADQLSEQMEHNSYK